VIIVNDHQLHFYFNISKYELSKENILEAEFHIYKLKPNVDHLKRFMTINLPKSHLLEVRVDFVHACLKNVSK
jgi:anti-dorsalizing morphogenetic protein, putative